MGHIQLDILSYRKGVKKWLRSRYGNEADNIWEKVENNYNGYLKTCHDYGGSKNGHSRAIYGGLLVFALYPALPDQPPISELQDMVCEMFMSPFKKLGKIFDLNRPRDMWLIDKVFRKSGNSSVCDYLVVGDKNPIADKYSTVRDENGFIVSREK